MPFDLHGPRSRSLPDLMIGFFALWKQANAIFGQERRRHLK
jgi:hypothetical protein